MTSICACALLLLGFGAQDPTNQELQATYEYLFSPQEQQEYLQLKTVAAQNRYWLQYWRRHDPTPDTEYNELLQLFARRFDYTYYFATNPVFADGWNSDRGKVYILFGAPSDIIRSPFGPSNGVKTEVWVYRMPGDDTRKAELVFEDRQDNGLYRLRSRVKFPREMSREPRLPEVIDSK